MISLTLVLIFVSSLFLELIKINPKPIPNIVPEKVSLDQPKEIEKTDNKFEVLIPDNLESSQKEVLRKAYQIAKADGHKQPEIVQGIVLQETKAGAMDSYKVAGRGNDPYYGLMQLKKPAALDVMKEYPSLYKKYKFHTRTNDELVANLILNENFNLEVGSKYLKILAVRYKLQGKELVNAYNRGPGGVKSVGSDYHYGVSVERNIKLMKVKHK